MQFPSVTDHIGMIYFLKYNVNAFIYICSFFREFILEPNKFIKRFMHGDCLYMIFNTSYTLFRSSCKIFDRFPELKVLKNQRRYRKTLP